MIINTEQMRTLEDASGLSTDELMHEAGMSFANALRRYIPAGSVLLFLCGKGNNGGDGYVSAAALSDEYTCRVYAAEGMPKTDAAGKAYGALDRKLLITEDELPKALKECDAVIDAVYGFGFRLPLSREIKSLFRMVEHSHKPVYSIDINSGCEADTGACDSDALYSEVTFALGYRKPFHALGRNHRRFSSVEVLPLPLKEPAKGSVFEMNEEIFFKHLPHRPVNAHKGSSGRTVLIGGSYGMAGALGLNILGAKTVGAQYMEVMLPEEIYPILASKYLTPVYHPFGEHNWREALNRSLASASAIAFGSGAVYMPQKYAIRDHILQEAGVPIILDAEALRMLVNNYYFLRFVKAPVILTPHIGEFSALTGKPVEAIKDDPVSAALSFAWENEVYLVLKGPNTIIVSPAGDLCINESGNEALAQAGSGDVLTGILAGLLPLTTDTFTAVCMAVWLHGYLAELGTRDHAVQNFDLEQFPALADKLFHSHGF